MIIRTVLIGSLVTLGIACEDNGHRTTAPPTSDPPGDVVISRERVVERERHRELPPREREVIVQPVPRDRDIDLRRDVPAEVPARAERVADFQNERVRFTPDRSGTLYVYDMDERRLVWSGHVHADERFTMAPADNQATLNGRPIFQRDLSLRHRYALYFERD